MTHNVTITNERMRASAVIFFISVLGVLFQQKYLEIEQIKQSERYLLLYLK